MSLCSSVSPTHSAKQNAKSNDSNNRHKASSSHATPQNGNTATLSNGKQRRLSRVSDATSERFAQQMSSFSRCATPSPVPRSGQQTPTGGSLFSPYSDYLDTSTASNRPANRLTVDFHNALQKLKPVSSSNHYHDSHDPTSLTTQPDDSPYASLLAELEQSLQEKKMITSFSPDNTSLSTSDNKFGSSSKSSSKDLEFSKELEAALQLIQELETPSEGPFFGDLKQLPMTQQMARSDSEKTLSAAVSLPSPEAGPLVDTLSPVAVTDSTHKLVISVRPAASSISAPSHHGKTIFNVHEPSSQSTSGYSSPSSSNLHRDYESSEASGCSNRTLNSFGCNNDVQMMPSSSARTSSSSTSYYDNPHFISTFVGPIIQKSPIYSNNNYPVGNSKPNIDYNLIAKPSLAAPQRSNSSANKSFLLFKKRSTLMPQSDFQNRIFKPECLAYLTEDELVQRHQLNRNVIRVRCEKTP